MDSNTAAAERTGPLGPRVTATELVTVAAIVAVLLGVAVIIIGRGAPLGHDEAVYSLRAETFVTGSDQRFFWNDYRAPGLPALLAPVVGAGGTEPFLRLTVAGFGALATVLTWLLGRALFGPMVGVVAAAGFASSPVIVMAATNVWPDLPGAALGLGAVMVVVGATASDRVSWWMVLAAPLAVAATVARFGAPIALGLAAVTVVVWRWKAVARSPLPVLVTALLAAAGVGFVLLVPGVVGAREAPWTSISSKQALNDLPVYQGLVDYVKAYDDLVATASGAVLVLGLAAAVARAIGGRVSWSRLGVSAGLGAATALTVALSVHGELRYLAPAYPWLWIGAAAGLVGLAGEWTPVVRTTLAVALAGVLIAGSMGGGAVASDNLERFRPLRVASRLVADQAADRPCGVLTSYVPQVAWYSGCVTRDFELDRVEVDAPTFPAGAERFLLLVQDGKRQPEGRLLNEYVLATNGVPDRVGDPTNGPLQYVEIFRIESGP